jgi:hypothetical protein
LVHRGHADDSRPVDLAAAEEAAMVLAADYNTLAALPGRP